MKRKSRTEDYGRLLSTTYVPRGMTGAEEQRRAEVGGCRLRNLTAPLKSNWRRSQVYGKVDDKPDCPTVMVYRNRHRIKRPFNDQYCCCLWWGFPTCKIQVWQHLVSQHGSIGVGHNVMVHHSHCIRAIVFCRLHDNAKW